jgi:NADPH:quinone reductase-like Zn-dependent oxidoreductase
MSTTISIVFKLQLLSKKQMNMKAILSKGYGSPDVLQITDVLKPSPQSGEVLIRIVAASVTAADSMMRMGTPRFGRLFLGLFKPKHPIPGTGFAGVVEAIGSDVKAFNVGDQVFGESVQSFGAHAEYVCIPQDGVLSLRPGNMTYEEAAPVCDGALTSMNFLKKLAKIGAGQRVLIIGASGSLGTSAVQLARYYGAHVTGVCSTSNRELVQSLGADQVIDYTKQDFTKSGQTYDIIYDTVGKSSYSNCKDSLAEDGIYMSPVLNIKLFFQMMWTSLVGKKKALFSATGILPVTELRALLEDLKGIIESGAIKSVIDRKYPLEEIGKAHAYIDGGHKKGNVIVLI